MLRGNVADELLDDDRLTNTGASIGADLAATGEGSDEIDDLKASLKDLYVRNLLFVGRGLAVDGPALGVRGKVA